MSRSDLEILADAEEHFTILQNHAEHDLQDRMVMDAVCMRLSAGLEALSALESGVRTAIFDDAWPLMWGMRNRIAHGYLLVDSGIVERTVEQDIPLILRKIARFRAEDLQAGGSS